MVNTDELCSVHLITSIIISDNLPPFMPSITDWNIHNLLKLDNENFQEGLTITLYNICKVKSWL
jgi:hypothetical protein